jgi:hypothetical protein
MEASLREAENAQTKLIQSEHQRAGLQQQANELQSQLELNTRQLLELQQELDVAMGDRDKLGLAVASCANVRAEQQVQLSKLSSQVGTLQREIGEQRNIATVARERAACLEAEKGALEIACQSYMEQHGGGDDVKLKAITDLNRKASHLEMTLEDQQSHTTALLTDNTFLREQLVKAEQQRIKMHNALHELKGNIRVFCRLRPTPEDSELALHVSDWNRVCLSHEVENHTFEFDRVFSSESSQADVFEEVDGLVQSALDGYKVCIFAYGQTGSGKTYTMQGSNGAASSGLIPRTLRKVFQVSDGLQRHGWTWSFQVSFMEVYNEALFDLLRGSSGAAASNSEHMIIQHDAWGTMVTGMTCIDVTSLEQVFALMAQAERQRSVGATDMNAASSRSHSVFAMYLRGNNESLGTELSGALHLVDLAGSERLDKSGATGERLTETRNINKSLSSLAHVFTAKAESCVHVPFRNSKLTHLMEPCLSGHGKTLMLVNVNPQQSEAHETLCSLRFARQVAQCNTGGKPRRSAKTLGVAKSAKPQAAHNSMAAGSCSTRRRADISPPPRRTSPPPRSSRTPPVARGRWAGSPSSLRGDVSASPRWKN